MPRRVLITILSLLAVGNILTYTHALAFGLTTLIWLVIFLPIVGSLLLSQFKIVKRLGAAEWVTYSTSLGIALLVLFGVLINTIGLASNHATLKSFVLLPSFDVVFLGLTLLAWLRGTFAFLPHIKHQHRSKLYYLFIHLPLLFPLLSVGGAIRLNNNGSDLLAIISVTSIAVYELIAIALNKKFSEYAHTINIGSIALALLLSVSMRSNHLIGFDIHQEFQVFTATLQNGIWQPYLYKNTYNACLSLTVLPTVLQAFIPVSPEYIFKFLMQLIFCTVPLSVYAITKEQLKGVGRYALVAALFFTIQNQFISEFPALIREQLGMLFFAALFVVAFSSRLSTKTKKGLLIIFGLCMIVSHYSTAYVSIALLIVIAILKALITRLLRNRNRKTPTPQSLLHLPLLVIVLLAVFSFFWYGETLQSDGGLVSKLTQSITDVGSLFSADSHNTFLVATLHVSPTSYNTSVLKNISKDRQTKTSYNPSTYRAYTPIPSSPAQPTIKNDLQVVLLKIFNQYLPLLVDTIIVVGAISILIYTLRGRASAEMGALITASGILFLFFGLFPKISQDYNLERLYQQLLILIGCSSVIGVSILCRSKKLLPLFLSLFIVIYFACTSGLANQLTFGLSNINFNNDGENYDHYYISDGEVDSMKWLSLQYQKNPASINLDRYSTLSAYSYGNFPNSSLQQGLLPGGISINSYVYESSTNKNKRVAFDTYNNNLVTYNVPQSFIDGNKNKIFDDGNSIIYK